MSGMTGLWSRNPSGTAAPQPLTPAYARGMKKFLVFLVVAALIGFIVKQMMDSESA